MLDAEDRQFLLTWAIRGTAAIVGVLFAATTLGLAYRVFELVRG